MPAPAPQHRLATTFWALVVPLAILGGALALALSWREELPDPVASHWAADGVDGFAPLAQGLWVLAGVVVPFSLLLWLVGWSTGRTAGLRRMVAFLSVWFAVAMCGVIVGSLWGQRGLVDARDAGGVGGVPAVTLGAATVLGVLAAWATPGDRPLPATEPVPADAPRVPLTVGLPPQRVDPTGAVRVAGAAHRPFPVGAPWRRTVTFADPWPFVGFCAVVVAVVGFATRSWMGVIVISVALGLVMASLLRWTVTIDHRGLVARPLLPRPRTVVPLDEVLSATAVQVRPLLEFGGWGYRVGRDGRTGIVLRKGEGILVRRTGGRELVVTVDDAAQGAAVLNTLAGANRLAP